MDINANLKEVDFNKTKTLGLDKGAAVITYNKYKGYTLPVVVMVVSILMLLFIVIPEIKQFFVVQKQLDEETQKLNMLKNNYNFLTNLNQGESDKNLKTLVKVLPTEKDFFGIMTSVSVASSLSSVVIENYKFSLGNLSKTNQEDIQYPTIFMDALLNGSGISVNKFINELYKTVPMVEVTSVKYQNEKANIKLSFYYKPFPPQNVTDDYPISQLSKNEQKLLSTVTSWNNLFNQDQGIISVINIVSTNSATPGFEATSSGQVQLSPFN